jgi:hypothetical protein
MLNVGYVQNRTIEHGKSMVSGTGKGGIDGKGCVMGWALGNIYSLRLQRAEEVAGQLVDKFPIAEEPGSIY